MARDAAEEGMKYLWLVCCDAQAFEALPKPDAEAIVRCCPDLDRALRESGHLVARASLE